MKIDHLKTMESCKPYNIFRFYIESLDLHKRYKLTKIHHI